MEGPGQEATAGHSLPVGPSQTCSKWALALQVCGLGFGVNSEEGFSRSLC